MKVAALGRHLLLRMDVDLDNKSKGGILIPTNSVKQEQRGVMTGVVLNVGATAFDDQPGVAVKPGTRVVVERYAGTVFYANPDWSDKRAESPYRLILDTEVRAVESDEGAEVDV